MGPLGNGSLQCLRRPGGAVWSGMPYSTYFWRRSVVGCFTPSGRPPSVFLCLLARNYRREGASRISLMVALAVADRSFVGELTGGGGRVPVPLWRKAEPLQSLVRMLRCQARVQEEVGMPEPGGLGEEEEPESV